MRKYRTSLVIQWIWLPMQGGLVSSSLWEDPTCHGATKPVCLHCIEHVLESKCVPMSSPCATTTEASDSANHWRHTLGPVSRSHWACVPKACARQKEKPPHQEACPLQPRIVLTLHNYRKPAQSHKNTVQSKKYIYYF